ncbi:MAG: hypothetical protein RIE59_08660 [Imperialibacter sp.]
MNNVRAINFFLPIIICLGLGSCVLYDDEAYDLSNFNVDDVIVNVTPSRSLVSANGLDTTSIVVELPIEADTVTVSIETNLGTFVSSGTQKFSGTSYRRSIGGTNKHLVEAQLKAGADAGKAIIQVQVAGFQERVEVEFARSYPNEISVTPSKIGVARGFGNEIELSIALLAPVGIVSNNHPIELTATDSAQNSIGNFRVRPGSYSLNSAKAVFSVAPDTSYVGPIHILINTQGDAAPLNHEIIIYSLDH